MIVACLHDKAVAYAGRGIPVLPLWWVNDGACACMSAACSSPGKHPKVPTSVSYGTCNGSHPP